MTHPYWAGAPYLPRHSYPYSELLEISAVVWITPPTHRADAS